MPTLGLSMIVKNGGSDLRSCLQSVYRIVTQIVIADTGSTDDTLITAAEFGAQTTQYAWNDNFSDARNAALEPMSTDWVLVLDADEELTPEALDALPKLLEETPHTVGGYAVPIRNYLPCLYSVTYGYISRRNLDPYERAKAAPCYTEHKMTRLFRRAPEIRFSNRLHESVDRQILAAGMNLGIADFRILHYGNLKPSETKRAYYRALGKSKLHDVPSDPQAWFEVALEEIQAGNNARALRYFKKSFKLFPSHEAAFFIAYAHSIEKEYDQALKTLAMIPEDSHLAILKFTFTGQALERMGKLPGARSAFAEALRLCHIAGSDSELSLQAIIESQLGFIEVQLGDPAAGIPRLLEARAKHPDNLEILDRMVKAWVLCNHDDKAAEAQEQLIRYHADEKSLARAATLRMRCGHTGRAQEILKRGLELFPGSNRLSALLGPQ